LLVIVGRAIKMLFMVEYFLFLLDFTDSCFVWQRLLKNKNFNE